MTNAMRPVRLGSVLVELPKSTLPAAAATEGGAYPFFCSSTIPKKTDLWQTDKSAILMGTGGIASVHLGQGKFAYSTDTWAFRLREQDHLLQDYAFRVLESLLAKIDYSGFEGSGLRHLRKSFIRNLSFCVPAKSKQTKICTVLSTIDTAIEQTEALIEKYQYIKAGLMHDLFTRGVLPNGQLRPPRGRAPELYQETAIGWIPKEWLFTTCEAVCEQIIDCKNRTPPETPDGHPAIRTPNVRNGEFVDKELLFTDARSYAIWTARGKPKVGDVVITREAPVGEVCMIPERHPEACLGQRMMLYRPNKDIIYPKFFLFALQSRQIQNRLDLISGGSTVGHVRVGDIRSLWMFMPKSKQEQQQIADTLSQAAERLGAEQSKRGKLRAQKLGLMQDLLTGKVTVKVDAPAPEAAA